MFNDNMNPIVAAIMIVLNNQSGRKLRKEIWWNMKNMFDYCEEEVEQIHDIRINDNPIEDYVGLM